jgi:hypothetical protein
MVILAVNQRDLDGPVGKSVGSLQAVEAAAQNNHPRVVPRRGADVCWRASMAHWELLGLFLPEGGSAAGRSPERTPRASGKPWGQCTAGCSFVSDHVGLINLIRQHLLELDWQDWRPSMPTGSRGASRVRCRLIRVGMTWHPVADPAGVCQRQYRRQHALRIWHCDKRI